MRLVICVDRDDDLGRKAGVVGPVIGRAAVLVAATKLGTADPEDTDTNALFAGVRLLDEINEVGDEAEVVVLTGAPKVGLASDRRIADQLDQVLKQHPATAAYFVSDGAEDEYLLPIVGSRVRIDGVRRVVVRQSPGLESTYYTLVRALKDPKLRAKTVLPFALVLLGLAFAAAAGLVWWGAISLILLIGVYLILWTFDIDEMVIESIRSASADIRQGAVAIGFGLLSLGLVGAGLVVGYNHYLATVSSNQLARVLQFLLYGLIWWFLAGEVWETGRAIRRFLARGHIPRSYPIASLSIVALGFVSYGIVQLVRYLGALTTASALPTIIAAIGAGLGMLVLAGIVTQIWKARTSTSEPTTDAPPSE
jgi:putative membrane protein